MNLTTHNHPNRTCQPSRSYFRKRRERFSLSPGERAGVRASVQPNKFQLTKTL